MPEFQPKPIWEGQEVFIIGGGPSLCDFDWSLLINENTIGCNNAFRFGPDVCDVCLFVDRHFILEKDEPREGFFDELAKFPNLVITNDTQAPHHKILRRLPWLYWMKRGQRGMFFDSLGYNFGCGATAVNLALILGAKIVYLLGYDMHLDSQGRPNYHSYVIDKPRKEVYVRMLASFGYVYKDLHKWPGSQVFNVNGNTDLKLFPILDPEEFWSERKKKNVIERLVPAT